MEKISLEFTCEELNAIFQCLIGTADASKVLDSSKASELVNYVFTNWKDSCPGSFKGVYCQY